MKRMILTAFVLLSFAISGCSGGDKTDAMSGSGDADQIVSKNEKNRTVFNPEIDSRAYSRKAVFNIEGRSCRPKPKGSAFGKSFLIVYPSGQKIFVPNSELRSLWSGGGTYRRGGGSYRNLQTWTSHGGAFIYSSAGNKSKSLTIYY